MRIKINKEEKIMRDALYGLGRFVVATTVGVVTAELFAIGANAAVSDIKDLSASIAEMMKPAPEPKKGLFGKVKKVK